MPTPVSVITALLLFSLIEWLYIRLARSLKIYPRDFTPLPGSQMPVVGGGFIILFGIGWSWIFSPMSATATVAMGAFLLIGIISFLDDVKPLSVTLRLLTQIVAVAAPLITFAIVEAHSFNLPAAIVIPLIIIWIVGFANEFNFMDGIDALTPLYSLVVLTTLPLLGVDISLVWPSLLAVLIFLPLNVSRSAISFCGDVGAILTGTLIATLLLFSHHPVTTCLIAVSVYLTDASLTIVSRICRRDNIFRRHTEHLYQLLRYRLGVPALPIAIAYSALQLIITLCYIAFATDTERAIIYTVITGLLLISTWILIHKRLMRLPQLYITHEIKH